MNVSTAEIYPADVAIKGDRIAAVGDVEYTRGDRTRVIDASGLHLTPGLIETHLHCYHSYVGVNEFAELLLSHGVTATADGFYGPGIVGGREAVRFLKEAFDATPLRLIFLVPTLACLQNRDVGLTPVPGISVEEMFEMLDWEGCRGLEEPPFLPITNGFPEFLDLFEQTVERGQVVTGHAAGITGRQLQAYVAMGASTDHEAVDSQEALERARAGMKILARQGSLELNVPEVIRAVTELGVDPHAFSFSTDVASPEKLAASGAIDAHVRVAIENGVEPIRAIQMATLNAAEVFGLEQEMGSISPGRLADLLLVDDLAAFRIRSVMVGGEVVVDDGRFLPELAPVAYPAGFYESMKLDAPVRAEELSLEAPDQAEVEVRVIGMTEGSLLTEERSALLRPRDGRLHADLEADVLPIVMVDRHGKGTGTGIGFVQGFGLKEGALASSVSTICSNLVAVGTNPEDMAAALNRLAAAGGGQIAVRDGEPLALVELPLFGLLSDDPLDVVMDKFSALYAAARELGCAFPSPFSQLEFCFVGGSTPALKLSEEGLLRVFGEVVERVDTVVPARPR